MTIDDIDSIINGNNLAIDSQRAWTFIEFVKMSGLPNNSDTFLTEYKNYLTRWSSKKGEDTQLSESEFVRQKMVDILKSITMTYSSYEEQQFIASLDWTDQEQVKSVIPLYVRKIREICEFYRKKRNEAPLIVERNKKKGSYQSVEQIVYEKVVDFIFNNRNLQPQMAELKQNLMVSIEQYVDTYGEYFDIPRKKDLRKKNTETRENMIELNMFKTDVRCYTEVNELMNELLYDGQVYLEEIPLIANLALDFSQQCVGELAELRDTLLNSATTNLIPLTEQINIKKRIYEQFLGVDLYYMTVDGDMNVKLELLCNAKNPSGNLLNSQSSDRAVSFSDQLELLSHIGLFFKPDKTSILKLNAKDFTWEINKDRLQRNSVYVFPDPNKYGDIGNNKSDDYPLIMEYKLDFDIRNISSGHAVHDPMLLIDEQAWSSYYSKQQNIFKVYDNKNLDYSFNSIANKGFIHNYQVDIYGNEFAIFKGYYVIYVTDENGDIVYDETGNPKVDHVEVADKFNPGLTYPETDEAEPENDNLVHYVINGGYFVDPAKPGNMLYSKEVDEHDGTTFQKPYLVSGTGSANDASSFFNLKSIDILEPRVMDNGKYRWTNIRSGCSGINHEDGYKIEDNFTLISLDKKTAGTYCGLDGELNFSAYSPRIPFPFAMAALNKRTGRGGVKGDPTLDFGYFGIANEYKLIYTDHYGYWESKHQESIEDKDSTIDDVLDDFKSELVDGSSSPDDSQTDTPSQKGVEKTYHELQVEAGTLMIKNNHSYDLKPLNLAHSFPWLDPEVSNQKVIDFVVHKNNLIIETEKEFVFIPYTYVDGNFQDGLELNELIRIQKDNNFFSRPLFNESEQVFYLLMMEPYSNLTYQNTLVPIIYKFEPKNYQISIVQSGWRFVEEWQQRIKNETKKYYYTIDIVNAEKNVIKELLSNLDDNSKEILAGCFFSSKYNLENFNFDYQDDFNNSFGNYIQFTYNNNLNTYLIAYIYTDSNGLPQIFEHKFKIGSNELFNKSLKSSVYSTTGGDDYTTLYNEYVDSGVTSDDRNNFFFVKIS